MADGVVTAFVRGSTAAITTMEFEPGGVADLRILLALPRPSRGRLRAQPPEPRHQFPRAPACIADRETPSRSRMDGGAPRPWDLAAAGADRLRRPAPRPDRGRAGRSPDRANGYAGAGVPRETSHRCTSRVAGTREQEHGDVDPKHPAAPQETLTSPRPRVTPKRAEAGMVVTEMATPTARRGPGLEREHRRTPAASATRTSSSRCERGRGARCHGPRSPR